ncbi:hypothetical protein OYC38_17535 [Escherichia coli]|uniref:hypothetical protein n=1 Tax=Enterobacteriaceae TaxID=543 RepID=UPI00079363F0|nr:MULTISPECIES: hypothetical protein [Enterobacteriaceae]MCU2844575.1 hypothetical protein [Enterobacter hormaechei subsp. steigerwaltii]EFA7475122.1 hypothetical protein [Escherichia coli]EFA7495771.1 hypothetical protein [Escherichia coli]EFF7529111.1 hypothetical protein [Escherichia coli]EFH5376173.1 hypothetical protein [Escherichia coli]
MTDSKEIKPEESTTVAENNNVSVSVIFRNVPKDKRAALEKLAKDFSKKHRKLVNYIEK